MSKETVKSNWQMACPKCRRDSKIDIAANIWVRLVPDGTDQDESADSSVDWNDDSLCICRACGHAGAAKQFEIKD